MGLSHIIDVLSENCRFHRLGGNHVVRDEQKLLPLNPRVVFRYDVGKLGEAAGLWASLKQQIQDSHEVALTAAKAAVEVGGLAASAVDGASDERQGVVEAPSELRGDDVVAQRGLRLCLGHAIAELQHEVATVNALRDRDEVLINVAINSPVSFTC